MATLKSTLYTASENSGKTGITHGDDLTGLLHITSASYTLTGSEAANDIILLTPELPPGAVIVPALSNVTCSADPGTTLTVKVGDSADDDRYAAALTLSAGGKVEFTSALGVAATTPYRPNAPVALIATIASAATLTTGVKLLFTIAYRAK